jgi:hypothetical protein
MAHYGKVSGGKPRVFEAREPPFLIVFGKVGSGWWLVAGGQ